MNRNNLLTRWTYCLLVCTFFLASGCASCPCAETSSEQRESLTEPSIESPTGENDKAPTEDAKVAFTDSEIIPITGSPTLGPDTAAVTVVMFSDLQCPFCKRGADTMVKLYNKYPNDVRIVLKSYPLPMHGQAVEAAKAAIAAGNQGEFWAMHDWLFAHQMQMRKHHADMKAWSAAHAELIGLDVVQFERDFDAPETLEKVTQDKMLGDKLAVRGTPHFFVNGERIVGARPLPGFEEVVEARLKEANALMDNGTARKDLYNVVVAKNYDDGKAEPFKSKTKAATIEFVPVHSDDPAFGNTKDPLVTIVEFSDFQCPFCNRVTPTVKQIQKEYGDQVRFVFKQLPLEMHGEAEPAARAALAAHEQGKFWEMHDLLFAKNSEFRNHSGDFGFFASSLAKELGLNVKKFKKDYLSPAIAEQVERDVRLAEKIGAKGTPNFWINGVNLRGAQPYSAFKSAIDEQLQRAKKLKDSTQLSGEALYEAAVKLNKFDARAAAKPTKPKEKVDLKNLTLGDAPVKGPKDAAVTIVMFTDFQCPYCKRGDASLTEAMAKFDGKVKLAFKHYPLPFHKHAPGAAKAALAAGEQDKFWEMHDLLFENQTRLDNSELYPELAKQIGLNVKKFKKDIKKPAYDKLIDQDKAQGAKVGVRGTPAFFINGTRLVGAQPAQKFETVIEQALKEAR